MPDIQQGLLDLPPWAVMWILAAGLWSIFKISLFHAAGGFGRIHGLYFLWIGMDTDAFAKDGRKHYSVPLRFIGSSLFLATGLVLLFLVSPRIAHTIARGWIGFVGMLCVLHFGLFVWMAVVWNHLGFPVRPIMNKPWLAGNPGEFWGSRWNRAFSDWTRPMLFRPLVRRYGILTGTLAGFVVSGLAHELVLSVPAKAGLGLPTLYFVLQGAGVLWRRGKPANRLLTHLLVLLPASLLFHPPFLKNVFVPFLNLLTLP